MKQSDIKIGETYLFVATDSPDRKHLEGQPFTVQEKKKVWRKLKKRRAYVYRFFNEQGEGAMAEELERIDMELCEMPAKIREIALKEMEPLPACEPGPDFARVDPKEYEVNDDKLPF